MKKAKDNNPKHQAISFLARRDHSVQELRTKLLSKGHEETTIDELINELKDLGYLDDFRYAQMILRHHYSRGKGPQKIRYDLQKQGVSSDIVVICFSEFDGDWYQLALDVREKRFGCDYKSTDKQEQFKERAKQMRFLMTRGFESEQIQYACESL